MENKEQVKYLMNEEDIDEDEETWRHTYRQEQHFLEEVRLGHTDKALAIVHEMLKDSGRLSHNELNHYRNLVIVGIALASRAVIEGGLPPKTGFRLSGYYIGKCDSTASIDTLLKLHDEAITDMIGQMNQHNRCRRISSYTESAKSYINNHYRQKIYLDEIADFLGITPTYLSRIFTEDTGRHLADYVNDVRVDRASNMLKFSDLSLSEIAEYVHFPSQSYFGKQFKERMGMTPRVYRERYRTVEWK